MDIEKVWATQLRNLSELKKGWDTYDADPPNMKSIVNTMRVLRIISDENIVYPSFVTGVVVGGVCMYFSGGEADVFADIECLNDGEILYGIAYDEEDEIDYFPPYDINEYRNILIKIRDRITL